MDDSRVRKASDLLGSILSPAVAAKADAWSRFHGFWNRAAGENLAAHSRPADVRNGIVFIEAEHPGWIQLLQMDQDRILDAIIRKFPELGISGIAFRLARDGSLPGTTRKTFSIKDSDRDTGDPEGNAAPSEGFSSNDEVQETGSQENVLNRTFDTIPDASFRSILSSLAGTLEKEGRGKRKRGP